MVEDILHYRDEAKTGNEYLNGRFASCIIRLLFRPRGGWLFVCRMVSGVSAGSVGDTRSICGHELSVLARLGSFSALLVAAEDLLCIMTCFELRALAIFRRRR
jgi:hypothetical protein